MYKKSIIYLIVVIIFGIIIAGCSLDSNSNALPDVTNDEVLVAYDTQEAATEITAEPNLVNDNLAEPTLTSESSNTQPISRSTGDGGAGQLVGTNYISFTIDTRTNSDSQAAYIDIYFGSTKMLRLYSGSGSYTKGSYHYYNCYNNEAWFESWDQDLWDDVRFSTDQTDGFYFSNVKIVHSSQVILDYHPTAILDYPNSNPMYFASPIRSKKYSYLNTSHSIVRKGLRDMGKTDDDKYSGGSAWCSEFARYCASALYSDLPSGSIGTSDMKNYYRSKHRDHNLSEVYNKTYTLGAGDYMSINNGGHSVIFAQWVGNPTSFNSTTQFKTIEGNSASTVRVCTRTLSQVDAIDGIGQN